MTPIDYKKKVKKVYPHAYLHAYTLSMEYGIFEPTGQMGHHELGAGKSELAAWQNAYETLQKEKKG